MVFPFFRFTLADEYPQVPIAIGSALAQDKNPAQRDFSKLGKDFSLGKGDFIPAINAGKFNIFRASTPPEQVLSNLVHEGTHALDNIKIKTLEDAGTTKMEIEKIIGNRHAFEIRAYTNQHNFEIAIGMTPNFKNVEEIVKHVTSKYPKNFN